MHKYYFANSCLQVNDVTGIFDERLACFCLKSNFNNVINLYTHLDSYSGNENVRNVSTGIGIDIGVINDNQWVFSAKDKNNFCFIETSNNCSELNCYFNYTSCSNKNTLTMNAFHLLRIAIECNFAYHNNVSIHASLIAHNYKAILFTPPSATGKSTQAELWNNFVGAKIINGDRPVLHPNLSEVRAYGVPWDGKEQLFIQDDYPVSAIVEVRQAKENHVRKLTENQAFKLLLKQCFIPMWDDTAKFSVIQTIRFISKNVPFYRLFCLPQESATELLNEVLFNEKTILLEEEQFDMKLKEGFILKNIVGEWIIMPKGNNIKNFEGAIVVNEIAAFIWKQLEKSLSREDLLQAVLDEYDVDEQTASVDLDNLIDKLNSLEILTQE